MPPAPRAFGATRGLLRNRVRDDEDDEVTWKTV
jgi:hypothetical protein